LFTISIISSRIPTLDFQYNPRKKLKYFMLMISHMLASQ